VLSLRRILAISALCAKVPEEGEAAKVSSTGGWQSLPGPALSPSLYRMQPFDAEAMQGREGIVVIFYFSPFRSSSFNPQNTMCSSNEKGYPGKG